MKSMRCVSSGASNGLTCGTPRPGWILPLALMSYFPSAGAYAQPAAASVVSHSLPFAGSLIDAGGNVYTAGSVTGTSLPVTPGAAQTQAGGGSCPGLFAPQPCSDAYVGKADAAGKLVFGTMLGGPSYDYATAITVDAAGNVFVVGDTGGSFPTTANAAISASTTSRVFAAKLSADGSRFTYSTYLPDTNWDAAAVALDSQGDVYVAGTTTTGHAFVTKLNSDGSAFVYNVTLPGTNVERATAIAVDASGNAIVTGFTSSSVTWVSPGITQAQPGGRQNVFIAKLDASGHVVFYTSVGGSGADTPHAIQLDSAENIYVAGQTTSLDFPTTPGTFQPTPVVPMWNNGTPGGFIFKLSAEGSAVVYSSYVTSLDSPAQGVTALAVTASGEAYLGGSTGAGFPVTQSAPQICFGGSTDVFVAHLDLKGFLLDATYLGGPLNDTVETLALPGDGSIMLAGHPSDSSGLPTFSRIRFGGAGWSAPPCLSPDALNAATLRSVGGGVSPGEFITLTGFGIGPDVGVAYQPDAKGQPPRQLAGVQVFFDGLSAPVLYAQSRQLNAQVPFELSGKNSTNVLVQYNGAPQGPVSVPVVFGSPGIFRLNPGSSAQAAALNQDGTINSSSSPANAGSVVSLFGTGFGSTAPPCTTGELNVPGPASLNTGMGVAMEYPTAGGFAGSYAPVSYAGSAPSLLCGVVQINMLVPANTQPGDFLLFPGLVMSPVPGSSTSIYSPVGFTIAVK